MADGTIVALIGNRFFANEAPAVARPLIIYQHINSRGERSLGGFYAERWAQFQWRVVADSYADTLLVKAAVMGLAGTNYSGFKIDVNDGADGFDFDTQRYTRLMTVYLTKT
jgi:hypothetical protein